MTRPPTLVQLPAPPEYRNSAGRLLRLLEMLQSKRNYYETIISFYTRDNSNKNNTEYKVEVYLDFMRMLSSSYNKFIDDVRLSSAIPDDTKTVILNGLSNLVQIVFPENTNRAPRPLQNAEIAVLRMAGHQLPQEGELENSDKARISESIEKLQITIDQSELPRSVRIALLEISRLSRNALEQYNIHGAKGFKIAFKRMLAELMEIYLEQGPKDVENRSWWKQAIDHVKTIDAVAGSLLKYRPLLETVGPFFIS